MQFSKRFFSINLLIFFNLMLFQGLFGQNRVSSNNNPSSPCSICGTDERVPSYNNAIGRIVRGNSVVGTAWATKNNKFVTAGHCFKNGPDNLTLEFNVPFSNTDKIIVHPSNPADIYTINATSIQKQDTGDMSGNPIAGKDWAVFTVYPNSGTGKYPIEQYGTYLNIDRKYNPTTIRITGYGVDDGSSAYIQQTASANFYQYSATENAISYYTDTESGNSGSPIIDEATGYAIGVHTMPVCPNSGTSLSNNAFYDAIGLVEISIDQYYANGSRMTGSTLGHWENQSFVSYPIQTTKFDCYKNFIETFKASQSLLNLTEKFNNWGSDNKIINHGSFSIDGTYGTVASYFGNVTSGDLTINSYLPECNQYNGNVEFKDPWIYDYADANYGNNFRNRGNDGIFYSYSTPLVLNINTTTSSGIHYNGIFLNQDPYSNKIPYSIKSSSQDIYLSQTGKTHKFYLSSWSVNNSALADIKQPYNLETPIVFKGSGAIVTANLKGTNLTNNQNAFSNPSQRKFVNLDGTLYKVYESMNRIWLEKSVDDGANWTIVNNAPVDEGPEAKSPSIDFVLGSTPAILVTYQLKTGTTYSIKVKKLDVSGNILFNDVVYASANSYSSNNATPVVCGSWGALNKIVVVWKEGTAGLYYRAGNYTSWTSAATIVTGTDNSSLNPAISVCKQALDAGATVFHLVWQQNVTGGSKIKYEQLIYYSGIQCSYLSEASSGSAYLKNSYPSIIVLPDGTPRLTWVGEDTEMGISHTLLRARQSDNTWFSTIYEFGSSVNNSVINLNIPAAGYVIGWTESNGSYNKYIRNTSFSNIRNFGITGKNLQVCNSDTWSSWTSMFGITLSTTSSPYSFNKSNSVESLGKESTKDFISSSRKAVVYNDSTAIYFALGDINVDGQAVDFKEMKETTAFNSWNEFTGYLTSQPFTLNDKSELSFSTMFGSSDSVKAVTLLGNEKSTDFEVELIDNNDGKVLGSFNKLSFNKNNLLKNKISSYKIIASGIGDRIVRLRLVLDNSVKGNYLIAQHYTVNNTLPKESDQEITYEGNLVVNDYGLSQNYPNPFNPSTVINYQTPKAGRVTLKIYDVLGKEVATLVDERKDVGKYSVEFNASSRLAGLTSGIYLYELRSNDYTSSKKMILVK